MHIAIVSFLDSEISLLGSNIGMALGSNRGMVFT